MGEEENIDIEKKKKNSHYGLPQIHTTRRCLEV